MSILEEYAMRVITNFTAELERMPDGMARFSYEAGGSILPHDDHYAVRDLLDEAKEIDKPRHLELRSAYLIYTLHRPNEYTVALRGCLIQRSARERIRRLNELLNEITGRTSCSPA